MEVREDFCGMCMAIPIALAGAGVAGISSKQDYQTRKRNMICAGLVVLVISLFLLWYYKDCNSCKM